MSSESAENPDQSKVADVNADSSVDSGAARTETIIPGALYLVATPIGNLADITQRAIDVLTQVDIVAAEDTRHSQRLLSHLGVDARLQACHEHNEDRVAPRLLDDMQAGRSVALISDAGTPLISDPGYRLVSQAHDRGIRVIPVPGVCAAIAALSVAGLATDSFSFEGFLPAKHGARCNYLKQFAENTQTMIFYESCHRILDTLKDMRGIFGEDRRVSFAREISKTFETIRRATLSELVDWVAADENQRKGEIVLIVEGFSGRSSGQHQVDHQLSVLLAELPVKQAVSLVVKLTGAHKNDVYRRALELKESD